MTHLISWQGIIRQSRPQPCTLSLTWCLTRSVLQELRLHRARCTSGHQQMQENQKMGESKEQRPKHRTILERWMLAGESDAVLGQLPQHTVSQLDNTQTSRRIHMQSSPDVVSPLAFQAWLRYHEPADMSRNTHACKKNLMHAVTFSDGECTYCTNAKRLPYSTV